MSLLRDDVDDELDPTKRKPLQDNLGMGPVKVASPMGSPMIAPAIGRPVSPAGVPMYNQGDSVPATGTAPPVNPHIAKAQELEQQGSGVSQVQQNHPFWGGVLRGLDVAATIAAPRIAQAIPGTTLHHDELIHQQEGLANQDVARDKEQAQTQEIQQRPQMQQAEMEHQEQIEAQKEAARQAQQAAAFKQQQDQLDQTLAQQQDTADQREEVADANRQSSDEKADQRFALQEKNADRRTAQGANIGTWSMQEDPQTGKPVLFNSKTGETREAPPGVGPKGAYAKGAGAGVKAISYANDYMQKGIFTGPGDEALMDQFFSVAKPDSGFRMTGAQQEMFKNSRSWMQSIAGQAHHATTGTWFTDKQRQEIVSTMNNLAQANTAAHGGGNPAPAAGNNDPLGIR